MGSYASTHIHLYTHIADAYAYLVHGNRQTIMVFTARWKLLEWMGNAHPTLFPLCHHLFIYLSKSTPKRTIFKSTSTPTNPEYTPSYCVCVCARKYINIYVVFFCFVFIFILFCLYFFSLSFLLNKQNKSARVIMGVINEIQKKDEINDNYNLWKRCFKTVTHRNIKESEWITK